MRCFVSRLLLFFRLVISVSAIILRAIGEACSRRNRMSSPIEYSSSWPMVLLISRFTIESTLVPRVAKILNILSDRRSEDPLRKREIAPTETPVCRASSL